MPTVQLLGCFGALTPLILVLEEYLPVTFAKLCQGH